MHGEGKLEAFGRLPRPKSGGDKDELNVFGACLASRDPDRQTVEV